MSLPGRCADFPNFSVQALQLLHNYEWVYSFKAIQILFPENSSKIPKEIKEYFQVIEKEADFHKILHHQYQDEDFQVNFPESMKSFLDACNNLCDEEREDPLREAIPNVGIESRRNWPKKKLDEVMLLSEFVGTSSQNHSCDLIIDIGSGLGYLSSHLAENYAIDVLGVESQSDRLVSSQTKAIHSTGNLIHVNLELTSDVAVQLQPFTDSYKNICLTGLHACGDLTPWSLKLFLDDPTYQLLAIVPCCYHKMQFGPDSDVINLPMSQTLKNALKKYPNPGFLQNMQLCRLASQRAGESFLNGIQAETKQVFYRSLLELYVHTENLSLVKNKRRGVRGCLSTFDEYIDRAIGPNGGFSIEGVFEANKERLQKLYVENLHWLSTITGIIVMQRVIQPIAENLILLDRLEFLVESGKVETACVKTVIPKSVTPRGRVIFATKSISALRDQSASLPFA